MKKLILLFLAWLIIINVFAIIANNRLTLLPDTAYSWINPEYTHQEQDWNLTALHARWDSHFFRDIARNGYSLNNSGGLSNAVFFPLYPFLISVMALFLNGNFTLSGWIVSIFFSLLSSIYLYLLTRDFHPQADPLHAVLLLLVFPTAFFLNMVYSESVFLFFSLAVFYHLRKKEFFLAGIAGFLASLTRLSGLFLVIPFLLELLNYGRKSFHPRQLLSLGLIPLGTVLFFLYHYFRFGDFFLYLKLEKMWGRSFSLTAEHFSFATNPAYANFILDALIALVLVIITYIVARKIRLSYAVYMALSLAIPIVTGTLMSIGRYALVLFPIYILGSELKGKVVSATWLLVSVLGLALYTILLSAHYWAG